MTDFERSMLSIDAKTLYDISAVLESSHMYAVLPSVLRDIADDIQKAVGLKEGEKK